MRKILILMFLISGFSFSDKHYYGKIINNECRFSLSRREKIVNKLFKDRDKENRYIFLEMAGDDFSIMILWYDKYKNKEYIEKIYFCEI